MRPTLLFIGGALLIWLVANGRAGDMWQAMTGVRPTPSRPPDPSTNLPPGALPPTPYNPPPTPNPSLPRMPY